MQNRLDALLADHERFAQLKNIKEGPVTDPLLARQIDVLYLMYQEKQVDPALLKKITAKANAIEQAFNVSSPAEAKVGSLRTARSRQDPQGVEELRRAKGGLGGE